MHHNPAYNPVTGRGCLDDETDEATGGRKLASEKDVCRKAAKGGDC